jgi:very-short-patch-repair endonuclease
MQMPRRKPLDDEQKNRARELRRRATVPESLLWNQLRAGRLAGIKFRRQHTIEPYVVDFYCHDARLVVELDGDSHSGRAKYDAERTARLAQMGVRVFRIGNDDVLTNMDAILAAILRACGRSPQ